MAPLTNPTEPAPLPQLRSGAVARIAQMPVATLRIWEQRHRAIAPRTTPSGHRLYGPADVQRVLLLRQLTQQGQAIGAMAALSTEQRQALCAAPPNGLPAPAGAGQPLPAAGLRMRVVGEALAARLQRPAVAAGWTGPMPDRMVHPTLADAARAAAQDGAALLLWQCPTLGPAQQAELEAALQVLGRIAGPDQGPVPGQAATGRVRKAAPPPTALAVLYRYASAPVRQACRQAGATLLREPVDDAALAPWLAALGAAAQARAATPGPPQPADATTPAATPRRYDDATLSALAGLPSRLACECPRHLAELLMQIASFEAYSQGCSHRDAADARLHAQLAQVAASARALFEGALAQVLQHEGLAPP